MSRIFTIEVDQKTKEGKAFLEIIETIYKDKSGVKIIDCGYSNSNKNPASFIYTLSKKTNRDLTKKLLAEHDIAL